MDFDKAQVTAERLITANGRSVVIQRLSSTPEDAAKPWNGPGAPTVVQRVVINASFVSDANSQTTGFGKYLVDEALLKSVEQVALVAGRKTDLTPFHVILDGAIRWKIVWVKELKPADTTVLYVFGLKR